jgi:PadR family transcriptional regulator PadR
MTRRLSDQALELLDALAREPDSWRYGYDLGQQVGLKAGTLYPILMRLSDRGLLESSWEADPPLGRPRRHLYRILASGQQVVATRRMEAAATVTAEAVRPPARRSLGRPATEGQPG